MLHRRMVEILGDHGIRVDSGYDFHSATKNGYTISWRTRPGSRFARRASLKDADGKELGVWGRWTPARKLEGFLYRAIVKIHEFGDFKLCHTLQTSGLSATRLVLSSRTQRPLEITDSEALSIARGWVDGEPVGVLLDWLRENNYLNEE